MAKEFEIINKADIYSKLEEAIVNKLNQRYNDLVQIEYLDKIKEKKLFNKKK